MSWKLVHRVSGGHRYFENESGRLAVADGSGATPDRTDDGVLWLALNRPVIVGASQGGGSWYCHVPVDRQDGDTGRVVEPIDALFFLQRSGMIIKLDEAPARFIHALEQISFVIGDSKLRLRLELQI